MKRAKRVERSEKHMLSFKMTTYHPYKVNLSERAKKASLEEHSKQTALLTLRLSAKQTSGNDELMLTTNQKKTNRQKLRLWEKELR